MKKLQWKLGKKNTNKEQKKWKKQLVSNPVSCNTYFKLHIVENALQLTEANKEKHFIGDFLPPDELAKFMEKVKAINEGRDPGKCIIEKKIWR